MLQKRYEGFLKTSFLWKSDAVYNLPQFEIISKSHRIDNLIDEKLRLGKYVEHLVFYELEQQDNITVLAENIQIQQNKTTLGELDCLLLKHNKPIHLEIIYKFYLYDDTVGESEIDHFIGPNRKDALKEKLNKLREKQFPLLYSNTCIPYLEKFGLVAENILQQVYFKAQLFLPFNNQNIELKTLNRDCVVGFYINPNELHHFSDCKFYIPNKKDWLIVPHTNVEWLNFESFSSITQSYFKEKYSSLLWIKLKNGLIKKVFLV